MEERSVGGGRGLLAAGTDRFQPASHTGETPPRIRALNAAMGDLRAVYPKSWALLDLLYYEEVPVEEIVETSGGVVTRDHIRKDKFRALQRLKKLLDNYPDFQDEDIPEGEGS